MERKTGVITSHVRKPSELSKLAVSVSPISRTHQPFEKKSLLFVPLLPDDTRQLRLQPPSWVEDRKYTSFYFNCHLRPRVNAEISL